MKNGKPTVYDVPKDLENLMKFGKKIDEKDYEALGQTVAKVVKRYMEEPLEVPTKPAAMLDTLRMSSLGKPDRFLYLQAKHAVESKGSTVKYRDGFTTDRLFTFMYGSLIEEIILWMVKQAGHEVTNEQEYVNVEGVPGHIDCRIDGTGVDVKSAANFSYDKFLSRRIVNDDPYGYLQQLGGYFYKDPKAGFLVINKESGHIAFVDFNTADLPDPVKRIKHLKEVLAKPEPPPALCYPVKIEENGNTTISKSCGWCLFKDTCFKNLRAFDYADEVVYMTHVEKPPRVQELDPVTLLPLGESSTKAPMFKPVTK